MQKKKSLMATMHPYYKKEYPIVVISLIMAAVVSFCMTLQAQVSQLIIDRVLNPALGAEPQYSDSNFFNFVISGYATNDYKGMLIALVITMAIVCLVCYVTHYARWTMMHWFMMIGENRMRDKAFYLMLRQSPLVLSNFSSGDILSATNNDTVAVKNLYMHHIPFIITAIFRMTFALYFLLRINIYLAIVPLATGLMTAFVSFRYRIVLRKKFDQIRKGQVELNTFVQENINGVRVIRAFASESQEIKGFKKKSGAFKDNYVSLAKTQAKYNMIFTLLGEAVNVIGIIIGIVLAIKGLLTVGEFATFATYATMIRMSIMMLAGQFGAIQNCNVCANRFSEFAEREEAVVDKKDALPVPSKPNIQLKEVTMTFDGGQRALTKINLDIPYGKRVGIMGATGSGKSVIMKLLNRLYDCTGGSLTMDGVNIKEMRVDEVRRRFSYVMQDVFLFSESVKKNVAFYDEETPQEEIEKACKVAQADGFIEKLTDGYETVVGEQGLGLSGGQKQRVSIARALLKNAPVILLDDCTSALDYETEKKITESLFAEYGGRTIITASHRASSVMNCDEIIYLEDGKIVERGTHDELMEIKGRYYGVFTEQEALRAQEVK
jgi:ATP-binding cassette subfamily B protein